MMVREFEQAWYCSLCGRTFRFRDLAARRIDSNVVTERLLVCPGQYCAGARLWLRVGSDLARLEQGERDG